MDIVLTVLDPEKEANVNAPSSDYILDAINHNTLNDSEPVMIDEIDDTRHVDGRYTFERNILAAQAGNIVLPSNGMVTSNESDDYREINMGNSVEIAAGGRLSIPEPNGKRPRRK